MVSSKIISVFINSKRKQECVKYILWGSIMLVITFLILILYQNNLQVIINNVATNFEDKCKITSIEITTHTFNCWSSENVALVDLPCVKILLETENWSNVTFYRNIDEKKFVNDNNADCSYLPTACQNDVVYMNQYLNDNLDILFPKPNVSFHCYLIKNIGAEHYSAFMYLPDPIIYYTSMTVISFGICISFSVIIYGLTYFDIYNQIVQMFLNSKLADKKILKKRKREQAEIMKDQVEDAYLYIKRVLDDLNRGVLNPGVCDQILFQRQNSEINVGRISNYNLPSSRKSSTLAFNNDFLTRSDSVETYQKIESDDNRNLLTLVEDQGLTMDNKRF